MKSFLQSMPSIRVTSSRSAGTVCLSMILCAASTTSLAQTPNQRAKTVRTGGQGVAEPSKVFNAICAGCHGLDGRGSERGPNISSRPEVVRRSDAELLQTLRNGISETGMPNFAALGDAKLVSLVGYLRTLQGKSAHAPIPGDPKRGESLFFGAARCSDCHMINGKGGFIGADLSGYAADSSPDEVRLAIEKPAGDTKRSRGQMRVALLNGQVVEGVVRNEDNFSLQLQSMDGAFHFIQKPEVAAVESSARPLMPDDYGQTLSAAERDDLVGYLMTVARSSAVKATKNKKHNDE
jgi:putative heme-binding domain-containing protein